MSKLISVTVRFHARMSWTNTYHVQWFEKVRSWKVAWIIVDACGLDRSTARKVEYVDGMWLLEIGLPERTKDSTWTHSDLLVNTPPR